MKISEGERDTECELSGVSDMCHVTCVTLLELELDLELV